MLTTQNEVKVAFTFLFDRERDLLKPGSLLRSFLVAVNGSDMGAATEAQNYGKIGSVGLSIFVVFIEYC